MPKPTKIYGDEIPQYDEEREWVSPHDSTPEPAETPEQAIARQIDEKRSKTIPSPVSEQKKPTPGSLAKGPTEPPIAAGLDYVLDKAVKSKASAERKKRWREKHGEDARRKEREYLKAWRAKRKEQS